MIFSEEDSSSCEGDSAGDLNRSESSLLGRGVLAATETAVVVKEDAAAGVYEEGRCLQGDIIVKILVEP